MSDTSDACVVESVEGLQNLAPEWTRLAGLPGATVFQSWEWTGAWLGTLGRRSRPSVLVGRDGARVVGLVPLCRTSSYLGVPVRRGALLAAGPSDYGGFLVEEGREEVLAAVLAAALAKGGPLQVLDLQEVPDGSPTIAVCEAARASGLHVDVLPQDVSLLLELPGSWDELTARLSKKFAWNVAYYTRRLERDHGIALRKVTGPPDALPAWEQFLELHSRRWRDKKLPGAVFTAGQKAFHRRVVELLGGSGALALYFLEAGDQTIAALYGFEWNRTFYYYLGGFDPTWSKMSVGTVLTGLVIRDCLERGVVLFDFLRGPEAYKAKWGAVPRDNRRVIVARPGPGARLIQRLLRHETAARRALKDRLRSA